MLNNNATALSPCVDYELVSRVAELSSAERRQILEAIQLLERLVAGEPPARR